MHEYNLAVFDLKKGFPNAQKIKTLLIVKPTQAFTDLDKLKLDQYVMGAVILFGPLINYMLNMIVCKNQRVLYCIR